MGLIGMVKNGVVVFDGQVAPAEGTKVRVEPVEAAEPDEMAGHRARLSERLLKVAGTDQGLPADMAENHDHYLHGQPKR